MQGMITKHEDLLGTLVHDVAHLLRHDIDRRVKKHNLTRVKWLALGVIEHRPNITQKQLAAELELGAASVGRLVDRLDERGFIVRVPSPTDRRAYCLSLKPQASLILKDLRNVAEVMRKEALNSLNAAEVNSVNKALLKIKQNLIGLVPLVIFGVTKLSLELNTTAIGASYVEALIIM
jgi:MarR family transcriptional regulator, transcriptional regulator for hemolysin